MKNQKGITLVVTIIVLIVLAGVSINILLGENRIITKAKEVAKLQDVASNMSNIQSNVETMNSSTNNINNSVNNINNNFNKIGVVYNLQLGSESETIGTTQKTYTGNLGNEAGIYIVFCNVVNESHDIFNTYLTISGAGTYRSYKGGAHSIAGYPIYAGYVEKNSDISLTVTAHTSGTRYFIAYFKAIRLK